MQASAARCLMDPEPLPAQGSSPRARTGWFGSSAASAYASAPASGAAGTPPPAVCPCARSAATAGQRVFADRPGTGRRCAAGRGSMAGAATLQSASETVRGNGRGSSHTTKCRRSSSALARRELGRVGTAGEALHLGSARHRADDRKHFKPAAGSHASMATPKRELPRCAICELHPKKYKCPTCAVP